MTRPHSPQHPYLGALVGIGLIVAWCVSLTLLLQRPLAEYRWWAAAAAALWMTWLSTGLFITAHDAIHGSVLPRSRRWNDVIGRIALFVYAGFPYRRMVQEHRRHHAAPGTAQDPDHHDGEHTSPLRWYVRFVSTYFRWYQFVWMALIYNVLAHALGVDQAALWAFWAGPVLISTVQLFVFGTWLPHRDGPGVDNRHHSTSSALPRPLSLLVCFHFDYHWEHHEWPSLPWWRLPSARWSRSR